MTEANQMQLTYMQQRLHKAGLYLGAIDGVWGPKTASACDSYIRAINFNVRPTAFRNQVALQIACEQTIMYADMRQHITEVDGLFGPETAYARALWQATPWRDRINGGEPILSDDDPAFPAQNAVPKTYGEPGTNLVTLQLPYPMKLAWDQTATIEKFAINAAAAPSARRALEGVLAHYGPQIATLGLDQFGGCFNIRKMRGGNRLSMHSWGLAIDFDPLHNQLTWGRPQARMSGDIYRPFFNIWEAEGWTSLGRARNFDWMHVQAPGL